MLIKELMKLNPHCCISVFGKTKRNFPQTMNEDLNIELIKEVLTFDGGRNSCFEAEISVVSALPYQHLKF